MNVGRLVPGEGEMWRNAVSKLVPGEDRSNELLSSAEAEAALADTRCYLLVTEIGGELVGLLSAYRLPDVECGGSLVYLYDIEVSADYRRQGIGKLMIQRLIALCEEDDVDLIWAGTEVSNEAARRAFESTGAKLEGSSYAEYEWDLEE